MSGGHSPCRLAQRVRPTDPRPDQDIPPLPGEPVRPITARPFLARASDEAGAAHAQLEAAANGLGSGPSGLRAQAAAHLRQALDLIAADARDESYTIRAPLVLKLTEDD